MTLEEAINTPLREVKKYKIGDEEHSIKEWANIMGVTWGVIYGRLLTHSFEDIYNEWKEKGKLNVKGTGEKLCTVDGETHNQSEWSKILGISRSTLRSRLKKKTIEEIVHEARDNQHL